MEYPVDFLRASSHEDLEKAALDFMSALLESNPDRPECFQLPDSTQVPIGLSTVGLIPLYGGDFRQKLLALFDPKDQSTAVALYLANQWWAVEDILKTADPLRKGLVEVQTLGERIVLYVLNRIVYRAHEIGKDEVPFLCHSKDDFVKVLWKDGKAIGFYSVKPKGSSCIDSLNQGCQLSVMDSVFVRKSYRGSHYGLQILEDFVQSFREDSLGIKYPLSTYIYKVCEEYLHMYPEDKHLLWEVQNDRGTYQKDLIAHKIINVPLKGGVMQESSENTEMMVEEKALEETVKSFMEEEVVIVTKHARVREPIRDTPVSSHSRTVDRRWKRLRERSEEVIEESAPNKINRMEYIEEIIEVPVEMFKDPEGDGEQGGQQGQVGQCLMQEEHWGSKLALETERLENKEATINSDLLVSVNDIRKESSDDLTGLEEATTANMSTGETMVDQDIAEQEASCVQVAHKRVNLQEEAVEKQTPSKHTDLLTDWAEKTVEEPVRELLEGKMSPEAKDKDHSKSISQMKEPISVDACQIMLVSQEESSFKFHEGDDVYQTASDFQKERKKIDEKEQEMGITDNMEEAVTKQHEELKDNDEEKTEVMPHEMDTTRGMKKSHKRSTRTIMFRHLEKDSHSLAVEKTAPNTTEEMKASSKQPNETTVEVSVLRGNTKKIITETPKCKYSKIKVKALCKKTNVITDRVAVEEVKSKQEEKAENTELMTVKDRVTTSIEQDIDVENIMDAEDDTPVLEKISLCGKNKTATDKDETSMEIVEQERGIKGAKMENIEKVANEKANTQESKTEEEEEVKKDEILVVKPDEVELSGEEKDVVEESRKEDIEASTAQANVAEETIVVEERVLRKRSVEVTKRKASPRRTPKRKSKQLSKQPIKDYKDDFRTTDGGEREEPKSTATEEDLEALKKTLNVGEESNTLGKRALRPRSQKLKSNPKVTHKSKCLSESLVQDFKGDLSVTDEEKEGNKTTTTEEETEVSKTNLNLEEEPATAEKRVLRKRLEKVKANATSEVTPKYKSKLLKEQPIQEYNDYLSTMDEEGIEEDCTGGRGSGQEKNDGSSEQRNLEGQKESLVTKEMNKGEKKAVGDNHTGEKKEGKTLVHKTNEIAVDVDLFQEKTDKEKDAIEDEETGEEMEVLTTDLSKAEEMNVVGKRVLRKQTEKIKGKESLSATTKSKCLSKQTTQETKCSLPALDQDGEENIARGDGEKMKESAEEESILQEDVLENNERSTSEKKFHKAGDEENMEKEVEDEQNAKQKATDVVEKEEHYEMEMQETDKAGTSIITVDETLARGLGVAEEPMVEERRGEGLPEPNEEEEEEKEEAIMKKGENKNMEEKNAEKKVEVSRAKKGVNNKGKAGEEGTKQEGKKEVENELVDIVGEVASEKNYSGEVQGGELVIRSEEETEASEDSLNEAEVLTIEGQTVLRESEENITKAASVSKSTQSKKGPLKEFKDNLPAEDNMENKTKQVKQKLEGEYEEVVTKEINLEVAMKDNMEKPGQTEKGKVETCFLEEINKKERTEKRVDETEKEVGENPIEEEGVKEHVGSITDKRVIAVDANMEAVLGKHKNEDYIEKREAAASQEAAAEEEAIVSEMSTIEDEDSEPILLGMRVLRGKAKIFQITPRHSSRQHRKRVLKNDEEEENNEVEQQESCKEKVTTADEEHVKKNSAEAIMSPVLKRKLPNRKCKITPP